VARGSLPGPALADHAQLFSVWVITELSLMLAVEAKVAGWLIWSGGRPGARYRALLVQSRLEGKRAIPATLLWLPAMPLAL
jgi:hypothetical protein